VNNLLKTVFFFTLITRGLLCAQTFQFGLLGNYHASQFLTPTVKYSGKDSSYVLSNGFGFGASATIYFDHGGYYHRKIYGIRLEGMYSRANQSYKFFPGEGAIDPDVYYQYRLRTSFIDIPVLFTFCPTHHQGLTVEAGPMLSFLQSVNTITEDVRNTSAVVPLTQKGFFNPMSLSFVGGAGIHYSFTESFALTATMRATYSLTSISKEKIKSISVTPDKRLGLGVFVQAMYRINKYDAKKNRGYKYYMKRIKKSR
jgi:hypothetical protein